MKQETLEWLRYGAEDLRMSQLAVQEGLYQPAVFHCQQAIEKLLKALWTERTSEGTPPRTHDLLRLASELHLEVSKEMEEFLDDLTTQFGPSHYPDVGSSYSRPEAEAYVAQTRKAFDWLRHLLS